MSIRALLGWCIAVSGTAIVLALSAGAVMDVAPGFLPVAFLAVVWAAKELEVFDLDAELALLLESA